MWFRSLLDVVLAGSSRSPHRRRRAAPSARRRPGSFRPHLETLEARWVLSALTVTGLVLRKRGTQKITLTDTLNSSLTGSVMVNVL